MIESFDDALVEAIRSLGGSKKVGVELWPTMDIGAAQRKLIACMSESRPEKLSTDEVMFIMRRARDAGCHVVIEWMCAELGYSRPAPIAREDARERIQLEVLAATKTLTAALAQLQRLESSR
jgi:hypothetical protein